MTDLPIEDRLRGENGLGGGPNLGARQTDPATPAATPTSRAGTDPYARLKSDVQRVILERLGPQLFASAAGTDARASVIAAAATRLAATETPLAREERERLCEEIADDILGYGPLEQLLKDPTVTEIMVNGYDRVYIERDGLVETTSTAFADDAHLMRIIEKIVSQVGRRIDEASPMVDARLPDGSRVNAIIPPLALDGPALTIRKFDGGAYWIEDLVALGTLTEAAATFFEDCVRGKLNILISGGTGTGKTTLLNALSGFAHADERIITIEDAAELELQQEHVIRLESRPPNIEGSGEIRIRELVRNALRMRPDRIIVGEVRGAETLDMLQAMNTGHEGSLTTIHANSPRDALARLETLVLTAGVELPLRAIREQIASAFDLVIHLSRLVDGSRRITHVTEVLRMESEVITLNDLFVARVAGPAAEGSSLGQLEYVGLQPHFLDKLAARGVVLTLEQPEALALTNGRKFR